MQPTPSAKLISIEETMLTDWMRCFEPHVVQSIQLVCKEALVSEREARLALVATEYIAGERDLDRCTQLGRDFTLTCEVLMLLSSLISRQDADIWRWAISLFEDAARCAGVQLEDKEHV